MQRFKGKNVLITGAGSGFGRRTAREKHRGENADDGNHDQELDQGETLGGFVGLNLHSVIWFSVVWLRPQRLLLCNF